jgi:hypothetical protein
MNNHVSGAFEVKLSSQKPDNKEAESAALGRTSIDKQFHGDLEATSKGEMLSAMTEVKGSGGYVAIERVSRTLQGRSGSFVLQHSGTMTRGVPQLIGHGCAGFRHPPACGPLWQHGNQNQRRKAFLRVRIRTSVNWLLKSHS